MSAPYYADEWVTLYNGDMREVLPTLGQFDCCVTDPPYGETSLAWDQWPDGWPALVAEHTSSMWCFGSMRMFLERLGQFTAWRLSQDVIWRKSDAVGGVTDRFRRDHEHALHWYRGRWDEIYHQAVKDPGVANHKRLVRRGASGKAWHGERGASEWLDDGSRYAKTVIDVPNLIKRALHPTEKPIGILDPLIRYACPPGDLILDPFAGSGSTALAARLSGRRATLIEADVAYCRTIARRLAQDTLDFGDVTA